MRIIFSSVESQLLKYFDSDKLRSSILAGDFDGAVEYVDAFLPISPKLNSVAFHVRVQQFAETLL